MKKFREKENRKCNCRLYFAVISSVALSCGGTALAQTNNVAAANADASGSSTNVTQLGNITVVGKLDKARDTNHSRPGRDGAHLQRGAD